MLCYILLYSIIVTYIQFCLFLWLWRHRRFGQARRAPRRLPGGLAAAGGRASHRGLGKVREVGEVPGGHSGGWPGMGLVDGEGGDSSLFFMETRDSYSELLNVLE